MNVTICQVSSTSISKTSVFWRSIQTHFIRNDRTSDYNRVGNECCLIIQLNIEINSSFTLDTRLVASINYFFHQTTEPNNLYKLKWFILTLPG